MNYVSYYMTNIWSACVYVCVHVDDGRGVPYYCGLSSSIHDNMHIDVPIITNNYSDTMHVHLAHTYYIVN